MKDRRLKKICFVRPDYHATFSYVISLRERGWKTVVIAAEETPSQLLYDKSGFTLKTRWGDVRSVSTGLVALIRIALSYRFFIYYGKPPLIEMWLPAALKGLFKDDFSIELSILRLLRRKVIYLPTGCLETLPKNKFSLLDGGKVCGNCGFWDRCNDKTNEANFSLIRKYFEFGFSDGSLESSEYPTRVFPWKSIDLELWSPSMEIPADFRLPQTSAIRIMHSNWLERSERNWESRNIKGTPYVVKAVERLKAEGYDVEYIFASDLHIADVRFLQAQADIVVEQLIYGWWGSTGVETMALGKPVVCYLRREWKENFLRNFPEHESLPIVEADTETIYDVLKELVLDENLRLSKGRESRDFAERHFSPEINSKKLESLLLRGAF
jgi:glycosyltransferase involved in cell wall biosynthesis